MNLRLQFWCGISIRVHICHHVTVVLLLAVDARCCSFNYKNRCAHLPRAKLSLRQRDSMRMMLIMINCVICSLTTLATRQHRRDAIFSIFYSAVNLRNEKICGPRNDCDSIYFYFLWLQKKWRTTTRKAINILLELTSILSASLNMEIWKNRLDIDVIKILSTQ
jgi:hypothetical protein